MRVKLLVIPEDAGRYFPYWQDGQNMDEANTYIDICASMDSNQIASVKTMILQHAQSAEFYRKTFKALIDGGFIAIVGKEELTKKRHPNDLRNYSSQFTYKIR